MREKYARVGRFMARGSNAPRGGLRGMSVFALLGSLALAAPATSGEASGVKDATRASENSATELAVYALSRGKGVPEPARGALRKARILIEGAKQRGEVIELKETRIGLEGETRLCIRAKDLAAAHALLRELRGIAEKIELFNVVVESCLKK